MSPPATSRWEFCPNLKFGSFPVFPLDTIVAHPCEPYLGVLGPSGVLVHILGNGLLNVA